MTGAGSGQLLAEHEGEFSNSTTSADPFAFGRDPSLTELDLQNQLENMREGDEAWAVESVKQNFQGAVGVEATVSADVHDQIEQFVFNDGGSGITSGLANSIRVYTGVTYPSGSALRALTGCIPLEYSIEYSQGDMVTYSLSMAYADEIPDPSTDLSTATRVSDGSSLPWFGADLQIDGASVTDLRSATLSISDIARLQYGGSPTANRGVIANPSATLDVEALINTPSRLDLARGGTSSAPTDTLDSVPGSLALTVDGTALSTYDFQNLKPDSLQWNQIMSTDDATDSITFNVTGENAVTIA